MARQRHKSSPTNLGLPPKGSAVSTTFAFVSYFLLLLLVAAVGFFVTVPKFQFSSTVLSSVPPSQQPKDERFLSLHDSPQHAFKEIVIFGDSFSDTGNVYAASNQTVPPSPPYWNGRFSNGRVYPDFIQERLGPELTIRNYAFGGATTNSELIPGYSTTLNVTIPAVNQQVASYLTSSTTTTTTTTTTTNGEPDSMDEFAGSGTLYILFSGYNDYGWWAYGTLDSNSSVVTAGDITQQELEILTDSVSSAVVQNMETLYASGGRNFVVGDLPPMQYFPEAALYNESRLLLYQTITDLHNTFLKDKLDQFQNDKEGEAVVYQLSGYDLLINTMEHPEIYGFEPRNISSGDGLVPQTACLMNDTIVCSDPFGSIFWDSLHPTTHFHFLVSEAVLETVGLL